MARRFTRRVNGQMMTTFRVRVDLSQDQIDDLIARSARIYGTPMKIEEILESRLVASLEAWWLDPFLDPGEEDEA